MRKEYNKLARNTGYIAIGSFASKLLGMLLIPFYTAVLSTEDYGISDLITTTSSLLFPIFSLGLGEAVMRFAIEKKSDYKTIYSTGMTTVLMGFVLLLFAVPIVKITAIGQYTWFFVFYFLFSCLHTITSYFVKGLDKVAIYSIAGLINSAVFILCNLLFLLRLKIGIVGYLLSFIIGHLAAVIYMFFSAGLYRYIIPLWRVEKALVKNMLKYSLPIIPNGLSWWIANASDKYVLSCFSTIAQVGIYSVSYKIPTIFVTIMGFFTTAWQLSAAEIYKREGSSFFFSEVYDKCFSLNIILATVLIFFSKLCGKLLFSNEFFEAWRYVPVLILANLFNTMAVFLGTIYTASMKTKMLSVTTVSAALINTVLNFILIPIWGAMGAAIATLLSYFYMWLFRLVNARKILSFKINIKRDIVLLIAVVVEIMLVLNEEKTSIFIGFVLMLSILLHYRKLIGSFLEKGIEIIFHRKKIDN